MSVVAQSGKAPLQRRLAAIMAGDVVGYSVQMGVSEADTFARLVKVRAVVEGRVRQDGGRIFARAGDGFLAEFASPVSAVRAGFDIQRDLASLRRRDSAALRMRIGVHLADVVIDGSDLIGDGVNIAARVEAEAKPDSVCLTQAVFEQVKRVAQLAFEDIGDTRLKNISEPVRLYRVIGEMENHSYVTGTLGAPAAADAQPAPAANSIVVLPFANMGGNSEQDYLADGFSEDLITELARFSALFVVSRNASFAYRGRKADVRRIGAELGVAFCLEGSVRSMGQRLRITAQLIATGGGEQIWADRFDCTFDTLFDVQDDIVASIVATVVGRMEMNAAAAAKRKKPNDMAAYDCLMRGLEFHRLSGVTRQHAEQALAWFDRAIERDPEYGRAHAWRACAVSWMGEWNGTSDWQDTCFASARRALDLDENEAESHRIMGSLYLMSRQYDRAEHHFMRALELNPNNAYVVARVGELYNFVGDGERALEMQAKAKRLDPFLPEYCRELEAVANWLLERYDQTLRAVASLPRLTRRAAAYGVAAATQWADEKAVREAAEGLLRIDPNFRIATFTGTELYRDSAISDRLSAQLAGAGLPP